MPTELLFMFSRNQFVINFGLDASRADMQFDLATDHIPHFFFSKHNIKNNMQLMTQHMSAKLIDELQLQTGHGSQ